MAQPTNTQHIPSPKISGGANDIYLSENSKVSGGNSNNDTIDKITIQTTGDATDFGDLSQGREGAGGASGD